MSALKRLLSLVNRYSRTWNFARNLVYSARGLRIHHGVTIVNHGLFRYGKKVTIGANSLLDVAYGGTLELGNKVWLASNVELQVLKQMTIGSETSIQRSCTILGDVKIGSYCIVAPHVYVSSGNHYYGLRPEWLIRDQDHHAASDHEFAKHRSKPVVIEEDCWIGINVVIMSGITIGRGCVIGANSVVTRDVSPYTVVGGVPARVLKSRLTFDPPQRIAFDDARSLPYFYSGFRLRADDLIEARTIGGFKVKPDFSLALRQCGAEYVNLLVKNPTRVRCLLVYDDQQEVINGLETEVKFKLCGKLTESLLMFSVKGERGDGSEIAIASAWLS